MTWHGSSTLKDRIFACLVFIIPILDVLAVGFGAYIFKAIPLSQWIFLPFYPLMPIYFFGYGGIQIVSIAIFFALLALVALNKKMNYLLRFYTMIALLLTVFSGLSNALLQLLGVTLEVASINVSIFSLVIGAIVTTIFAAIIAASVYAVFQAARGNYAKIPIFSDAASRFLA